MDNEIEQLKKLCEEAQNADWNEVIERAVNLRESEKAFIQAHRPGIVKALWSHFQMTRDKCGCTSANHERAICSVRLIEKLLLEEELH